LTTAKKAVRWGKFSVTLAHRPARLTDMPITLERLRALRSYDPLTGQWHFLVDTSQYKRGDIAGHLSREGYMILEVDGKRYRSARLAYFYMTGNWPSGQIDHRDLNKANDAWLNLRDGTHAQNQANMRVKAKSGFKGVYASYRRWVAMVRKNGKTVYLGTYDTPEEAHEAYKIAAGMLFGEFMRAS
jgi:HNH endonuclease